MKNRKLDLLTEVNIMREMMGLSAKTLLKENFGITLLTSLARSAGKYGRMTADAIGRELGAVARATKPMFDDLARAVATSDEALVKATITNIVNTLDTPALTRLADDILVDTGELATNITKRVQSLKGAGAADDVIKQEIKQNLDDLFVDTPDALKSALKNQADGIINQAISQTAKVTTTTVTSADILARLSRSSAWAELVAKYPKLRAVFMKRIDDLIAAGAKSEDEIFAIIEGQVAKKLEPSIMNKLRGFRAENPIAYKSLIWATGLGIGSAVAGSVGLLPMFGKFACELFIGKGDEWCVTLFSSAYNQEAGVESAPTEGCDKTEEDFKDYVENNLGVDASTASFDPSNCTGEIFGDQYKWDGTNWV